MATEAQRAIEAILMVADTPVEPGLLAQLLEVTPARIEEICAELAQAYDDEDRGFVLARVAGGYRFHSHTDLAPYVERFVLEGQTARLSAAALETLAIVAYKQPVSRAQVAAIRGVNADGVLRTLEHRGYIAEVDRDPGPGQALLYGTTSILLERLGLDSLDDLPALADFVPGPEIMEVLEHSLRFERQPRDGPVAAGTVPDSGGDADPHEDDGGPGGLVKQATGAGDLDDSADFEDGTDLHDGADLQDGVDAGVPAAGRDIDAGDEPEDGLDPTGLAAADDAAWARLAAENAPRTDEGGIDDFRADDLRTDDFRTHDAVTNDFRTDDFRTDDSGDESHW